ncbi:aminotransferase class IV [uncultured Maricaulis sp.]|uniref:aminotransferase class IV n=1 Tax=uncultured Maricaulis sp. TaxID=174710 RepID=UPI0030DD69F5|tara:strand:+ start:232840 stop:233643 length:804 start_codon:yes stop_codon:yes gene_type:complete
MTVWLNGDWLDDAAAGAAPNDRGLLLGDGLFETLRFSGGRVMRLAAHEQRLRASCAALGMDCPLDQITLAPLIEELAGRNGLSDAAIRLTLTAGVGERGLARPVATMPSCLITTAPLATPPAAITLATSTLRRSATSIAARHKTLSYIDNVMARREARAAGADMALLLDTEDNLSGADCANLFWRRDGRLFTPLLDCAVLPGTVRAALIAGLEVEQGRFAVSELADARCVFVTNALMGAVRVSQLDGRHIGRDGRLPAEVAALLGEA